MKSILSTVNNFQFVDYRIFWQLLPFISVPVQVVAVVILEASRGTNRITARKRWQSDMDSIGRVPFITDAVKPVFVPFTYVLTFRSSPPHSLSTDVF